MMKKFIEAVLITILFACGVWVFTLQRSEITELHAQIDTLKAKNVRLFEQKFIYDTISVYVFRGFVGVKR